MFLQKTSSPDALPGPLDGRLESLPHNKKADMPKTPPRFTEGERAILGGLLLDPDAAAKVIGTLDADDFYTEAHRICYAAIQELFERNQPVDYVTLTAALKQGVGAHGRAPLLEQVGGVQFLTDLVDAVPSAANIVHYATLVKDKAVLRRLISAGTEVVTRCYEDHEDVYGELDKKKKPPTPEIWGYEDTAGIIGLCFTTGAPVDFSPPQIEEWNWFLRTLGLGSKKWGVSRRHLIDLLIIKDLLSCGFGAEIRHQVFSAIGKDFKFINLKRGLLQIQVNIIAYEAEIDRRISEWNAQRRVGSVGGCS